MKPIEQLHPLITSGQSRETTSIQRRLRNQMAVCALLISQIVPGCVYHRRGAQLNPLKHTGMGTVVAFPWKATADFKEEYELKLLASIACGASYPLLILEGIGKLRFEKLFYVFPNLFYALETDEEDIERLTKSAQEVRMEHRQSNDSKVTKE